MKRKKLLFLLVAIATFSLVGCEKKVSNEMTSNETVSNESTTAAVSENTEFAYKHNPEDNKSAMEDIIVNPNAVYGYSPNPESKRLGTYAEYDWTDPEFVANAKKERIEYHKSFESMNDILRDMRSKGASIEEMAKAVSTERNVLRLAAYKDDEEGLKKVKQSNLDTYGNENGPTPESLYEKYGSWEMVLQKAYSSNPGMDACCGLYDDYYWLYVELGLIEK